MIYLGNTNGMVENIYYYMWYKDDSIKQESFNVQIPETIIFKNGMPQVWYFTGKNGQIMIKKPESKKEDMIVKSFCDNANEQDVVGYYIYPEKWNYKADEYNYSYVPELEKKRALSKLKFDEKLCLIYITKEKLRGFLRNIAKSPDGILQKFIQPLGEHETVIQAVWSPSVCLTARRQNYRDLYDYRYDPHERCATFDGSEVYSRTVPLRGKEISNKIRDQAKMITQKIINVSYEMINITRIVMYFKPDKDNKLWFLYSSSLRTDKEDKKQIDQYSKQILKWRNNPCKKQNNTPLALGENFELPFALKQLQTTNTIHPVKLEKDIVCFDCGKLSQQQDLYHVPYSLIISTFHQNLQQNPLTNQQIKVKCPGSHTYLVTRTFLDDIPQKIEEHELKDIRSHIPPLILKIYPNITTELYGKLCMNDRFLTKTILLCENCFLQYSMANFQITGAKPQTKQVQIQCNKKEQLFQKKDLKQIISQMNLDLLKEKRKLNLNDTSMKKSASQFSFLSSGLSTTTNRKERNSRPFTSVKYRKSYQLYPC